MKKHERGNMLTTGIEGICDRCGEESDDLWMGNCSPCNDAKEMEEDWVVVVGEDRRR
jgi:predicted ATP-dependent serine protease